MNKPSGTNKKIISFKTDNEYNVTDVYASFNEDSREHIKVEIKLSSTGKTKNKYDIWNEIRTSIYSNELKYPRDKELTIKEEFKSVIQIFKQLNDLFREAIEYFDPCADVITQKKFTVRLKNTDLLEIQMIPNNEYFCVIAFETNKSITLFKINDIFDLIRIQNEINDKYTWAIKRYHDYFIN